MAGTKGEETKLRILSAASELLAEQGYHGTGIQPLLKRAGAPRGSVYFHFPGGKDEITAAAIEMVAEQVNDELKALIAGVKKPEEALEKVGNYFSERLVGSEYRCGCPVSTVALELSGSGNLTAKACQRAYQLWQKSLENYLRAHFGDASAEISQLAFTIMQGGLLLAQAQGQLAPLEQSIQHLKLMLSN